MGYIGLWRLIGYGFRGAQSLNCYYDEKNCFRSLSITILYLEKMYQANCCDSISKTSLIFFNNDFSLNCPPLPNSVPVELHSFERAESRENVTPSTYEFNVSMCEPS